MNGAKTTVIGTIARANHIPEIATEASATSLASELAQKATSTQGRRFQPSRG